MRAEMRCSNTGRFMYMYNFGGLHLCRICLGLEDRIDLLARVAEGHSALGDDSRPTEGDRFFARGEKLGSSEEEIHNSTRFSTPISY